MMETRSISVVIPSYNSAGTIENCVTAVLKTRYPQLEIIVVDDCSTDTSPHIAQEISDRHSGIVRLVRQERNRGPAAARNRGAREALGEYLFFLDSDTEILADALENFSRHMQSADAVTGIYDSQPVNPGIVPQYKALLNYYFFSRKGVCLYEVFDASRAGIRKEAFWGAGGFNEGLARGMDYENEEFGYRLTQKYKNVLAPDVRARHVFPGFMQLTKDYFRRVALWVELFLRRQRFESGGVTTPSTAISSLSLLGFWLCLLLSPAFTPLVYAAPAFLIVFFCGYWGFYRSVLGHNPGFLLWALACNIYFTTVVSLGALWGAVKVLLGSCKFMIFLLYWHRR